jgi:hypothetical protein
VQDDDDVPSFARKVPQRSRAVLSAWTVAAAIAVGVVVGRLYVVSRRPAPSQAAGRPEVTAASSPSVQAVEAIQQIHALSQALEAFRRERGKLPAGPWVEAYAALSGKYLSPSRLARRDPWNQAIRYVTSSDRMVFLLLSPGEDGIYQVEDRTLSEMLSRRCQVEKAPFGQGYGTDLVSCNGFLVSAPVVEGADAPRP